MNGLAVTSLNHFFHIDIEEIDNSIVRLAVPVQEKVGKRRIEKDATMAVVVALEVIVAIKEGLFVAPSNLDGVQMAQLERGVS